MTGNSRNVVVAVDRIEDGHMAVLVSEEHRLEVLVPIDQLPEGTTEGDWLRITISGGVIQDAVPDDEAEREARERVRDKINRLRKRGSSLNM